MLLWYKAKNVLIATTVLTFCNRFIVKACCYQQACWKLFQQVVTSLQMTSCNKPDFKLILDLLQLNEIDRFVDRLPQAR